MVGSGHKRTHPRAKAADKSVGTNQQPFKYTAEQWLEIEASVSAVRPETQLSARERMLLGEFANAYRAGLAERQTGGYKSPKQRAQLWGNASRLCAQLSRALEIAAKDWASHRNWRALPALLQDDFAPLLGQAVPADAIALGEVVDFLTNVEVRLRDYADPMFWRPSKSESFSGRLDPSVVFFQKILHLWCERFGGRLGISRGSGGATGPLGDYFFAVVRPVMGNRSPSAETLRDIVDRQKQFQKWHAEHVGLRRFSYVDLETEQLLEQIAAILAVDAGKSAR
jgi:hypothetical protein